MLLLPPLLPLPLLPYRVGAVRLGPVRTGRCSLGWDQGTSQGSQGSLPPFRPKRPLDRPPLPFTSLCRRLPSQCVRAQRTRDRPLVYEYICTPCPPYRLLETFFRQYNPQKPACKRSHPCAVPSLSICRYAQVKVRRGHGGLVRMMHVTRQIRNIESHCMAEGPGTIDRARVGYAC